jgi:hypothetical protein
MFDVLTLYVHVGGVSIELILDAVTVTELDQHLAELDVITGPEAKNSGKAGLI